MSSSSPGVPNEVPDFTRNHAFQLLGAAAGMILFIFLLRKVINVIIIDICILGDCSAWKKVFCCNRDGNSGPHRWGSRDAIALQTIGAFANPLAYLYNDNMQEDARNKFLDVITETELISTSKISDKKDLEEKELSGEQGEGTPNSNGPDEESQCNIKGNESMAEGEQLCSICLQELDSDACEIRNCRHGFHATCIKSWISRSLSCPVCRENMITTDRLRDYMSSNQHLLKTESR